MSTAIDQDSSSNRQKFFDSNEKYQINKDLEDIKFPQISSIADTPVASHDKMSLFGNYYDIQGK